MNRIFRRRFALLSLPLIVAASATWAQDNALSPVAEPPALTEPGDSAAPEAGPADGEKKPAGLLGLAGEGKYRTWTHHSGSVEESVVAIRVSATDANGNPVTHIGSGFVLRCDGFVVAPEALAPPGERNFKAELSFVKRDGDELTAPLSPVGRPAFRSRRIPYVTLKVKDSHFPSLPILHPRNIRPDAPARVTWAVADAERPGRVKAFSRKAIIGAQVGREDRYTLRLTDAAKAGAPEPPEPIVGAVVTDDKGTAALGILTDAPETPKKGEPPALTFATFAHLDSICEEVGLCPSLADALVQVNPGAFSGMAIVGGGPVRVPEGPMRAFYMEVYRTDVVCTPTFRIDRLPVTVGDYRAYLRSFRDPRLPQGWDRPSEIEADFRRPDLPATGMLYDDAAAYAASLGKRLPTAVEWLKALQGADGDWYREYFERTDAVRKAVRGLYQSKKEDYERQKDAAIRALKDKGAGKPAVADVWVTTDLMSQLNQRQFLLQRKYMSAHWLPGMNSPVQYYPRDVSASGVRDVLTNAPEMVIRNYARLTSGQAPKPYPSVGDPYLTIIHVQGRSDAFKARPEETEFRTAIGIDTAAPAEIDAVFGLFLSVVVDWSQEVPVYFEGSGNHKGAVHFRPTNYPGFRCAK